MIISQRHRYVFERLPRTGSRPVPREWRELYDVASMRNKRGNLDRPRP
jgi:hypothetical protein